MPDSAGFGAAFTPPPRPYRPTRLLPFELREHVNTYLGEELYFQALTLLTTLLTTGTAVAKSPALIPTSTHLALAATLCVHPSLTTRAKTKDSKKASHLALSLLRLANTLVGPQAAGFDKAFDFKYYAAGSRLGGSNRRNGTLKDGPDGEGELDLEIALAGPGSLWKRAEDFWAVVGWAFNCSVMHVRRWETWATWLDVMMDILERDWDDRTRVGGDDEKRRASLLGSLIFRYLDRGAGGYGKHRRIMRAILADGRPKSVNEFKEIFKNEPRELRRKGAGSVKKREVEVNIEQEVFGDYLDGGGSSSENDGAQDPAVTIDGRPRPSRSTLRTGRSRSANTTTQSPPPRPATTGPIAATTLRLRLLSLLTTVSISLPESYLQLDTLNDLITEHVRPLPIPTFSLFVAPSLLSPSLPTPTLVNLLDSLISSPESAPEPLTPDSLTRCYLPYAANTTTLADNTKVSLILEALLRRLVASGRVQGSRELRLAVETGVTTRVDRVQSGTGRGGSKRGPADDGGDFPYFVESGERLGWVADALAEG